MDKETKALDGEVVQPIMPEDANALGEVLPTMNVTAPELPPEEKCIVSDEKILGVYDEVLQDCADDRKQADELLSSFVDMVMNGGDATSSSKEAVVNLLKLKADISDKKAKIADLMTRMKLKERDTFPRYLAASQHNNVIIENTNPTTKRDILKAIQTAKRAKGNC
jgi:hypothetical protein